jgi:hypothetical protein
MKILSKNERLTRACVRALIGALALTAAACAGGGGGATTVSPSGATPASLNSTCNGGNQHFTMTVTPHTLSTPGPAQITVTITNDPTSSCNQKLGSAQFTVPADLNFVSVVSMTVPAGKSWEPPSVAGSTILVGASTGTDKLEPGQSVSLLLNVSPTICKQNTFAEPTAWTATFSGVKDDPFDYVGTDQKVEVSGCVVCDDKHAPAVANDYVKNVLGIAPNDIPGSIYGAMIHEIGQLTGDDGTFMGLTPCQHPAYENAVIAYVNAWIAAHSS